MSDEPNVSNKTNIEGVNGDGALKKAVETNRKKTTRKTSTAKDSSKKRKTVSKSKTKIEAKEIVKETASVKKENEKVSTVKSKQASDKKTDLESKKSNLKINSKGEIEKTKKSSTKAKSIKKSVDKNLTRTAKKDEIDEENLAENLNYKEAEVSTTKEENIDKSKITNFNTYLFHQGNNYEAYNILGSHARTENGKKGIQFVTWAPNATEVFVVGDFNNFEVSNEYKLERITDSGLWKGFFEQAKEGQKYKYCIRNTKGELGEYKADPYAIQSEFRPENASIIYTAKDFKWNDKKWITERNKSNILEKPLNIYEIHLGSWKRNAEGGFLTYEEISEELPGYLKEMGYTHVEIMPLVEHPLDASWGYQGTGYYSPTSRYGKLEGLKTLVNRLHEENIGVIMDWAPGHFCKDAHGLYHYDGSPTYEYQDEWRAENKGWGTCNFDLGRREVKSFLISNALYWIREFHFDGLRVDAVSSILYLDYSRNPGEWVPNKFGGNGNLEAIDFLKELNTAVFKEFPTALMIAEESTAWPNVTKSPEQDGLGFNLKWNMGWMNDTLEYVQIDPKYRKNNHRNITFAMMYNYAENYLLPLSHDEVVHGKKSLVNKMWGDTWNKYAGLRAFIGYMMGHPGKKLTFMGCEFAQGIEWRDYEALQWNLIDEVDYNRETQLFFKDINNLYKNNKAFWQLDHDYRGFNWIEADNNEQSILIFIRRSRQDEDTLVFVINFTPVVYYDYQIGVPFLGEYEELFNTDDSKYGGSGQVMDTVLVAENEPYQNQPFSLKIKVPPMATLILKVNDIKKEKVVETEKIINKEIM